MNATELVTDAYYLSDIVSRELEEVSGSQLSDGLRLLNGILDEKSAKGHKIPFNESFNFTAVAGQEKYFIPNMVNLDTITFVNENVRYSMRWVSRDDYHGKTRILNINTFPGIYTTNRVNDGIDVYIYFSPDQQYEFEVWGKFFLDTVTLTTDVSITFPRFFVDYLWYALANRICQFNNIEFAPNKMQLLMEKEKSIFEPESKDLTIRLANKFNASNTLDYAAINIYRGIWPNS